jgi:O-glycosyl hydrolase
VTATGGAPSTGGSKGSTGGSTGKSTGGATGAGGTKAVGGTKGAGGQTATGGEVATGGETTAGGANTGGKAAGGATATGGKAGGGTTSGGGAEPTGGTTSATGGGTSTGVTVQLDSAHQTIQGFGINDTWASDAIPAKLFSTTDADGLGLSILRVGMGDNGQDFSSNIPGDITTAKAAGAKIIGSCWSPPANCKDNNKVNDGGHLLTSCYTSWSDTIVSWAKSKGLYAMSIGNEPDFASCGSNEPCNGNYPTTLFTAKEMVAWVKVAGKKLQDAGIKVIAPEASEWIHNWSNISATGSVPSGKNSSDPFKCGCFGNVIDATTEAKCSATCTSGGGYDYGHWLAKDADAWKAFDIMGVHEYDTQHAEAWPADVTEGKVTKEIWQTEMSGVKWWPEQGTGTGSSLTGSTTIENGVAVAGWIHSAMVVGQASAWLYWWYKPLGTDDNEGLLVKSGAVAKRYYTLGNYSKFVRPGQVMVDVTGNSNANVLLSAYKGASDTPVVVVAINKGTSATTVPITIAGGTAPPSCTPYVTSSAENLKAGTAVSVSGGTFTASLGGTTVTTFVCK